MSDVLKPKVLKDAAVYWAPTGVDEFNSATYADPVQIKCRWLDVAEQYLTKEGKTNVSKSKVYVDRDVKEDGVLFHGTLDSVPSDLLTNPLQRELGGWRVEGVSKLPNRKNTKFLRKAML